jgi:hypothetical protein
MAGLVGERAPSMVLAVAAVRGRRDGNAGQRDREPRQHEGLAFGSGGHRERLVTVEEPPHVRVTRLAGRRRDEAEQVLGHR